MKTRVAIGIALAAWAPMRTARSDEPPGARVASDGEAAVEGRDDRDIGRTGSGDFDLFSPNSGGTWMALGAVRVTSTSVDGQNGVDREVDAVGAQLGGRAHLLGTIDFVTFRMEGEAAAGGSRSGLDAEGAAELGAGLAYHLGPSDAILVRPGVGVRAFGNDALDVEALRAVVEAGIQHHGDDVFVDVAPVGGLTIVHVGAGATAERDVETGGGVGGRIFFAAEPAWISADYVAAIAHDVVHLAGGSLCLAPDGISGCLDARFVAATLQAGDPARDRDVTGAYAGLAIGYGGGVVEK